MLITLFIHASVNKVQVVLPHIWFLNNVDEHKCINLGFVFLHKYFYIKWTFTRGLFRTKLQPITKPSFSSHVSSCYFTYKLEKMALVLNCLNYLTSVEFRTHHKSKTRGNPNIIHVWIVVTADSCVSSAQKPDSVSGQLWQIKHVG